MVSKPKDKQEVVAIIISILIAFLMWIYVMGEKNPPKDTIINNVPVVMVNTENISQSNLALMPNQKFSVDLNVTGRALDVFKVTSSDFRVEADMSGYLKKGENKIPIDIKPSIRGLSVTNKSGSPFIKVKLDALAEKTVPILINVRGNVSDGYGYTKPLVRPTEVMVLGPATYVNSVFAALGNIDISSNFSNISGSVSVKAEDKDGNIVPNVNVEPKFVDVTVSVKPSKEVPITVKTVNSIGNNKVLMSIKPQLDRISIIGDKRYIDKINEIPTTPVDLSKVYGSTTMEVFLNIPAGVKIVGDINSINAELVVENKIEKVISVPINFLNESSDYTYTPSDMSVTATVSGPESIMKSVDENSISASVDMGGFIEGTHEMQINVSQIEGVGIKTYSPAKVTVIVAKK